MLIVGQLVEKLQTLDQNLPVFLVDPEGDGYYLEELFPDYEFKFEKYVLAQDGKSWLQAYDYLEIPGGVPCLVLK